MTAHFEIVRSDAGWFARFIAANGREVWRTSETYKRRAGADRAVARLWEDYTAHDVVEHDERTCSCGSPSTTSLNPAEVVVHRVGKPCYIAARSAAR